jgi:hypothetical protein
MMKKVSELLGCASATNVREKHDFYQTPHECTAALIRAEGARMPWTAWDPCCGEGDIAVVLQASGRVAISTDLVDRSYGRGGLDFLKLDVPSAQTIVTNPPWSLAEAMVRHAARIGVDYLAFLLKTEWLNAQERSCLIDEVWCPAREYRLLWRPDFTRLGRPPMNCSWFVFERRSVMTGIAWETSVLWERERPPRQGLLV